MNKTDHKDTIHQFLPERKNIVSYYCLVLSAGYFIIKHWRVPLAIDDKLIASILSMLLIHL